MFNTSPLTTQKTITHLEYNIEWHGWQKIEVRLQSRRCVLELRNTSEWHTELCPLGEGNPSTVPFEYLLSLSSMKGVGGTMVDIER